MLLRLLVLTLSALVALPSIASAQLDEPHGFVEPCTVGNEQEMDTDCELCAVPQGAPQTCAERLASKGYEKACRTHGTPSGWSEVWCVQRKAAAGNDPKSEQKAHSTMIWVVLAAAAALGAGLFFKRGRGGRGAGT